MIVLVHAHPQSNSLRELHEISTQPVWIGSQEISTNWWQVFKRHQHRPVNLFKFLEGFQSLYTMSASCYIRLFSSDWNLVWKEVLEFHLYRLSQSRIPFRISLLRCCSRGCPWRSHQNFVIISFGNLAWLLSRAWTCGGCWLVKAEVALGNKISRISVSVEFKMAYMGRTEFTLMLSVCQPQKRKTLAFAKTTGMMVRNTL